MVEPPNAAQSCRAGNYSSTGNDMNFELMFGRLLKIFLVLGASVMSCAQTQAPAGQPLPQRGSEKYWLVVGQFADHAVQLAYAKSFLQLHEGSLTDRQCQQYSRVAVDYTDQLATVKQAGVSAQSGFWNDVREYLMRMIGPPGVPIPVHPTSKYWVTTGSEMEDSELRRIVSLEVNEASSQFTRTDRNSALALRSDCRTAVQDATVKDSR